MTISLTERPLWANVERKGFGRGECGSLRPKLFGAADNFRQMARKERQVKNKKKRIDNDAALCL